MMGKRLVLLTMILVFLGMAAVPALALPAVCEEEAAGRLLRFGIVEGFPGGDLRLEETVTKAQLAKILVEMAGEGEAAEWWQTEPPAFPDLGTRRVWYTGYVNLASERGWITGYPDGTFRPGEAVTYAEAVSMMMRLLGYQGARLEGPWPLNYLVAALENGVTYRMDFAAEELLPRRDAFRLASQTLDRPRVAWNEEEGRFVEAQEGRTLAQLAGFE